MNHDKVLEQFAQELKRKITGEVRFDAGSRALYTVDASNYRQIPFGVVLPKNREEVIETVALCRKYALPITSRGAGTSIAGQTCNEAVIIDHSKYFNRILSFDPDQKRITVEPGIVLDQMMKRTRAQGLIFGPDPATHSRCTLGGMIGNNSCGIHSLTTGKVVENIESLEILTYNGTLLKIGQTPEDLLAKKCAQTDPEGEIYSRLKKLRLEYQDLIRKRFPKLSRRVSGYNLDQLLPENHFHLGRALVGTEGTCVILLSAALNLVQDPKVKHLVLLGYPDIFEAARDTPSIMTAGPYALEGLDYPFINHMRIKGMHTASIQKLPNGRAWLLIEMAGRDLQEVKEKTQKLLTKIPASVSSAVFENSDDIHALWAVRESAFGATVFVPNQPDVFAGWEDAAVPPVRLEEYLRKFDGLLKKYRYTTVLYGHFGEGCIHSRISFDLKSQDGIKKYREFIEEATGLVISLDGSISGEHGDGQARAELLPRMFGAELVDAFRQFKEIWDPAYKMNPGKVVRAYKMDENLKFLGEKSAFNPSGLHLQFPEDQGNFFESTRRCIGIGRCRQEDGGMCPSYMATMEEQHSTRGRAHALYEMMRGEVLTGGWQDEHVKETLDLCLSCKACKTECPTNVDIASYKAEFLSHYYSKNKRPLSAQIFGNLHRLAPIASRFRFFLNFLINRPGFGNFLKRSAGLAEARFIPEWKRPFTQSFRTLNQKSSSKKVLLWVDTFSNYFHPEIPQAAANVLNRLGYEVQIPKQPLCCGRPLYDYGMLSEAKRLLVQILDHLLEEIEKGTPLVGLEPGCMSVFRDELLNFFPQDPLAQKLSRQSFLLSEFLDRIELKSGALNLQASKAIVVSHCHQKALWGQNYEAKVLNQLGLKAETLSSGCCGMAGAFGFEKDHYEVSMKIAEKNLSGLSGQSPNTAIICDGFSCREQIYHRTGKYPLHLAQVIDQMQVSQK